MIDGRADQGLHHSCGLRRELDNPWCHRLGTRRAIIDAMRLSCAQSHLSLIIVRHGHLSRINSPLHGRRRLVPEIPLIVHPILGAQHLELLLLLQPFRLLVHHVRSERAIRLCRLRRLSKVRLDVLLHFGQSHVLEAALAHRTDVWTARCTTIISGRRSGH